MNEVHHKKRYWYLIQQVYRFWDDVLIVESTPEEAYRQAIEQMQIDWSHAELLENKASLTSEEEMENVY